MLVRPATTDQAHPARRGRPFGRTARAIAPYGEPVPTADPNELSLVGDELLAVSNTADEHDIHAAFQ